MPRTARAIAIAVAALVIGPAAAQAVTVGVSSSGHSTDAVSIVGTPERDVVTVTSTGSGWAVAANAMGTSPDAGYPCTPTAPLAVQCPDYAWGLAARLGDGDDDLQITPVGASSSSSFSEYYLDGGPGDDVIRGGDEPDQLLLSDGHDTLDGGGGIDTLVPFSGAETVDIDLRAGTATQGDRSATVANIENVAGAPWAGTITGDDGPNKLQLGSGTVSGGAGDDVLIGGTQTVAGKGTLIGGDGDDTLRGWVGWNANCGAGRDDVVLLAPTTRLTADCETVTTNKTGVQVVARPSIRGRTVRTVVRCVATVGGCQGRISAPVLGRSASAKYSLRPGEHRTLTLPTAKRPRSERRVTVAVSVAMRGHSSVRRWSIPLR